MTVATKARRGKASTRKTTKKKTKKKTAGRGTTTRKKTKKTARKAAKKKTARKKTAKKTARKATKKTTARKKATRKKSTRKTARVGKTTKKAAKKTTKKPRRRSANARKPVELRIGDPAPAFELDADDGKTYSLVRLAGQRVVLYFYPKDNTTGCTVEACEFRDRNRSFKGLNTIVLGVSGDSLESHAKFRAKYRLPFPLLTDPGHKISTCYGAYGKKKSYGRETVGTIRSTYVISPEGRIEAIYQNVRAKGHAESVLRTVREAEKQAA